MVAERSSGSTHSGASKVQVEGCSNRLQWMSNLLRRVLRRQWGKFCNYVSYFWKPQVSQVLNQNLILTIKILIYELDSFWGHMCNVKRLIEKTKCIAVPLLCRSPHPLSWTLTRTYFKVVKILNENGVAGSWPTLRSQFPRRMHRWVASTECEMSSVPLLGLSKSRPQCYIESPCWVWTVICHADCQPVCENPTIESELYVEIAGSAPTCPYRNCKQWGWHCFGNCWEWGCCHV